MITKALPHYSYEDYRQWEGDWELIEGMPYAMAPSPLSDHQYAIVQIVSQVSPQLEGCKKNCYIFTELDWIIEKDTVLRPDVAVICKRVEDYIKSPPEVIFEVVSKATSQKDEYLKFQLYEREKVPFYVLVYPELKKARIFRLKGKRYNKIADCTDQTFEFETGCRFRVNFGKIWY
ncbi:MAG: hypothetical protein OHK0032_15440 [Thermodesulfovibrionales bacterium]